MAQHFQAIVIGTGFGGAVTACRLAEAGFDVCVLERGRRYGRDDFPRYPTEDLFGTDNQQPGNFAPPPDFSRWLWSRDQGIYDVKDLNDAVSIQAAGYGGGSLIYANVHLRPPHQVFETEWPEAYRRRRLDPYFDLAAFMLRVSLTPKQLAKTRQMQRAAETLHPGGADHWFRTPLAIDFDGDHKCEFLARCCLGCEVQAKNTLDMNYLALAERPRQPGGKPAEVRTLAEVACIEHDGKVFSVTYNDLLFRPEGGTGKYQSVTLTADYVFLCAGALNTTELLMRHPKLFGKPSVDDTPLGSHYFPNADSLGAVFNCDLPHEADYGPTITSAVLFQRTATGDFATSLDFLDGRLVRGTRPPPAAGDRVRGTTSGTTAILSHSPVLDWGRWEDGRAAGTLVIAGIDGRGFIAGEPLEIGSNATATARGRQIVHDHWFLLQDGGYPPNLEPLVGIFKSPLWMRRNRFVEFAGAKAPPPQRRPSGQRLMVQSFANSFGGTSRSAGSGGVFERAFGSERLRATALVSQQFSDFLPPWFTEALEKDKKEVLEWAAALALPMLGRILNVLSQTVSERLNSAQLPELPGVNVDANKKQVLIRGMLRQGLQILAGSEAAVATKAVGAILDTDVLTPAGLLDLFTDLLLWSLAYGAAEGNTAIVLINGRDVYRGRLRLTPDGSGGDPRLTACLPPRALDTTSVMQERVLRKVAADAWRGELRVNPAWTTLGRRLTVHSQGGCPMGPKAETGVTDEWGEVYGCKGLFVMDAAAFPTSVGVNPSATIAAVAEYKIEHFIREHGQPRDREWTAGEKTEAAAWVGAHRADLDPLNDRKFTPNLEPRFDVLGLTFNETMTGAFEQYETPRDPEPLENIEKIDSVFKDAEDAGFRNGGQIEVRLTAKTADLARLIAGGEAVETPKMSIAGWIFDPRNDVGTSPPWYIESGFLQLFARPVTAETGGRTRYFHYALTFEVHGEPMELVGIKVLRNSPGLDAWSDTSTVYFELRRRGKTVGRGILRVPLETFLRDQLPSILISGTSDTARRSWALGAFYKFFMTELAHVYASRAEAIRKMLAHLLTDIHV